MRMSTITFSNIEDINEYYHFAVLMMVEFLIPHIPFLKKQYMITLTYI